WWSEFCSGCSTTTCRWIRRSSRSSTWLSSSSSSSGSCRPSGCSAHCRTSASDSGALEVIAWGRAGDGNVGGVRDRGEWCAAAQDVRAPILTSTALSDQLGAVASSWSRGRDVRGQEGGCHAVDSCSDSLRAVGAWYEHFLHRRRRSEEHTSELQSRGHLV